MTKRRSFAFAKRWQRLLRVFVACIAFMVVHAPAPSTASVVDDVVLVAPARVAEAPSQAASTKTTAQAASPKPSRTPDRIDASESDPTCIALQDLVLVPDKYLRHQSLLC